MKGINAIAPLAVALSATSVSASVIPESMIPAYFKRATSLAEVSVKGNGGSSDAVDPIADESTCTRDITEFQKLNINTVRVYTIDNSANHDACMSALSAAGIYLALDVNTPKYSINQDSPADSYNAEYLQSIFATIDEFSKYSNTLLFFSGNEDINSVATTISAPYVKAVTRDMKQYIANRKYRAIPVGYSAADIDDNRVETAHYMNCGTDDERSDFFAFNDYSWCDPSTFATSTWQQKVQAFGNYSIPIFLSEYGCVKTTRQFQEVATLYGSQMTSVYSGGLVYEYSKEGTSAPQDLYGLVSISGSSVSELTDFTSLQTAFKNTPLPTDDGGYKPSGSPSICPTKSSTWLVSGDALPAMPAKASQYFTNGAGSGPGLSGSGSQDAGAGSTGTASAGSGASSSTSTSKSKSTSKSAAAGPAAELSFGPLVCGLVVAFSSLLGAALL
ncbi:1,3-beta-glucanosyltransferase GAS5, partial [Lecanoromycetidae sp. Uapishka_2]